VKLLRHSTQRTSKAAVIKYATLCEVAGWNCEHGEIVNETLK
jgi:hypothetical protein